MTVAYGVWAWWGVKFSVSPLTRVVALTTLSHYRASVWFGCFRGTNNRVISIFPRWGHFLSNFHYSLAAKLLIWSKMFGRCKNGTYLLYHHAEYGGDRASRAGCRRKCVMFFLSVCLSRFGMTKFVKTETLWSSVIFLTCSKKLSLPHGKFRSLNNSTSKRVLNLLEPVKLMVWKVR